MRCWLLTNTLYGNWLPGDERGSVTSVRDLRFEDPTSGVRVEHDAPGTPWEGSLPGLQRASVARLKCRPIHFDHRHASVVLAQFLETAKHREWSLIVVAIMFNHVHLVVQSQGNPSPRKMLADFKAYASRALNRRFGRPDSRTWWTTNGSTRKLPDERAVAGAVRYVLRQYRPLALWSVDEGKLV